MIAISLSSERYLNAIVDSKIAEQSSTVVRTVSEHSTHSKSKRIYFDEMKRLVVLTVLFVALSAGQVHRMPSSYKNGVKWEFGTDIFRDVIGPL